MNGDGTIRVLDERSVRFVFASVATVIGIATIVTRSDPEVYWSLVAPTVLVFWAWALFDGFPKPFLYVFGFGVPVTLNLVASDQEVSMFLVVLTAAIVASMERDRVASRATLILVATVVFVLGITGAMNEFAWPNWLFGIGFAAGFGELAYRYTSTIS